MAADVDEVLDSEAQPVQRSRAYRGNFDVFDEGIALCGIGRHFKAS
jgi:hypothetical protein